MTDLFDNPMGLDGFEFVEFAAPEAHMLEPVFAMLGFTRVANHRSKDVSLYRQGNINFILNADPDATTNLLMDVPEKHPGYTHMALRVSSLATLEAWLAERDIAITGRFSFGGVRALFIRDPDGNVIEFDEYEGADAPTRIGDEAHG